MATIKDKIGLAMLPSAQSGGASTSTSDFSGTVHSLLPIQYESPNLLTNGGFDQDSDWTKGTGWDIIGGKAVCDGTQTGNSSLSQSSVLPNASGKTYKITFTISNYVNGSVQVYPTNTTVGTYPKENANGTYTRYVKVTSATPNDFLYIQADANFNGSIDNVSVQLVSNGDFQFERSSSATRVGSDGYIKNVEVISDELVQNGDFEEIGSELITNGGFDTDSDWTKGTGWSISGGKAVSTTNASSSYLTQSGILTASKTYKIVFTVSNYSSGTVKAAVSGQEGNSITANGTYVEYLTSTGGDFSIKSQSGSFIGSIDNVSVKEVDPNGYWVLRNGFSIKDGKLHNDGTVINQQSEQKDLFAIGSKYKLSFDLEKLTSGVNMRVRVGTDGANNETIVDKPESGVQSYEFIANGTDLGFLALSDNTGEWTIDNISVKEITDDTDIPRLDYTNQACPSLLLEPQRSNLVTYSEHFESSDWSKTSITIDDNISVSPDGSVNASRISSSIMPQSSYAIFTSSSVSGTLSYFAKDSGARYFVIVRGTYSSGDYAIFDLEDGVITKNPTYSGSTAEIKYYGNGWYRCILSSAQLRDINAFAISGSGTSLNVAPSGSIDIYGAQLEQGSYPTSYIPTNGSTVTRLADVCNNAGNSTIVGKKEFTLFTEWKTFDVAGSTTRELTVGNSATNCTILRLEPVHISTNSDIRVTAFSYNGGVTNTCSHIFQTKNPYEYHKFAFKVSEQECSLYFDGEKVSFDNTVTGLAEDGEYNYLAFSRDNSLGQPFYGNVRQILYFDQPLSDTELERLTSSDITQVLRNYNRRGELLGATYESTHVQTKLNELF